jgi:hypothetical protein
VSSVVGQQVDARAPGAQLSGQELGLFGARHRVL